MQRSTQMHYAMATPLPLSHCHSVSLSAGRGRNTPIPNTAIFQQLRHEEKRENSEEEGLQSIECEKSYARAMR
jgi:hypothetical protein